MRIPEPIEGFLTRLLEAEVLRWAVGSLGGPLLLKLHEIYVCVAFVKKTFTRVSMRLVTQKGQNHIKS